MVKIEFEVTNEQARQIEAIVKDKFNKRKVNLGTFAKKCMFTIISEWLQDEVKEAEKSCE